VSDVALVDSDALVDTLAIQSIVYAIFDTCCTRIPW